MFRVWREKLLTKNLDLKTLHAKLSLANCTLQAWQFVGEQFANQHCHDKTFLVYLEGQSEPAPNNTPVGHSVHGMGCIFSSSLNQSIFLGF